MSKTESKISSGLPNTTTPRHHYDIYAVLEAPQELYFGAEKEVNVNIVETVRVWTPQGESQKCYISPTKRRGVERRCLLWSDAGGNLLMDKIQCGIPDTCCGDNCPVCRVFGGMKAGKKTFIGRLTHSGGVAVSGQMVLEKQRAMHPALISKDKGSTIDGKKEPMPYRKEYAQPGLLYPISNHCLSIEEDEFATVAYAFLMSLNRLGAGNPKGVSLARANWSEGEGGEEPLLVVDQYRTPLAERPIISPTIADNDKAIATFIALAQSVGKDTQGKFTRRTGKQALEYLQQSAGRFEQTHLTA